MVPAVTLTQRNPGMPVDETNDPSVIEQAKNNVQLEGVIEDLQE